MARGNKITRNAVCEEDCDKVVRGVTLVHFLLMFGYKLFSAYFPLFLVIQGLTLPQVGYSYLLIYLPIALCAPITAFFTRRTNPVLVMVLGIIGYAAYAMLMIFNTHLALFFFWQVMLGVAASLFFTSSRILLIAYPAANIERGFSWFYNAPFWADALAPVIGGLLIWRVGFVPVFTLSVAITLAAAFAAVERLWDICSRRENRAISLAVWAQKWRNLLARAANRQMAPLLAISFAGLWASGIFAAFFILFLKNALLWSQSAVIAYTAASSAFFSAAYIFFIRPWQKGTDGRNIAAGAAVSGVFSMMFAMPVILLNYASVFVLEFFKNAGGFVCNSGRSALVAKRMEKNPDEAGAFDTIFSPLGIALGSITAGLLVGPFGYQGLFFLAGAIVSISSLLLFLFQKGYNESSS
jgi:MFS family permease